MSRLHFFPTKRGSSASASASASSRAEPPKIRSAQIPTLGIFKDNFHPFPHPPYTHLNVIRSKAKRVTDPLNEAVRSRLCGNRTADALTTKTPTVNANPAYSTSGSDHGIESSTLADMKFLEEEEEEICCDFSRPDLSQDCESDGESSSDQHSIPFWGDQLCQMLEGVCSCSTKLEMIVHRDVTKAMALAAERAGLSTHNEGHKSSHLRRFVMNSLQSAGYNAGICKSRWEQTNGYPAGDYEFIDVVVVGEGCKDNNNRLLVDMDFRAQFEIARPTAQYAALVEVLPSLFVGRADKLRDIIKIMCDAAKRSLKAKGMHLPPWRKYRYIQTKWLGPHMRTTNPVGERQLLLREFDGMASFKGMGWDAGFIHQMELHFEKAVREANKVAQAKLKRQKQASSDPRQWENEAKYRASGGKRKTPVLRISGLAAALAEAAIHSESSNVH